MEGMELSTETRALHARLSPMQLQFLEFVERHPEGLRRASFAEIESLDFFMRFPMQSWPIFLGEAKLREVTQANAALYRLVKALPSRVFDNDPARLAEFYGIDFESAGRVAATFAATREAEGALARGDFIDSPRGFLCTEMNLVSHLGGWGSAVWAERYLRVPVLRTFLEENPASISSRDTLYMLFCHMVDEALRSGLAADGELNLCVLRHQIHDPIPEWNEHARQRFRQARMERGGPAEGEILLSEGGDLAVNALGLFQRGRRIHAVVETVGGEVPEAVVRAQLDGTAHVYNGPMCRVLSDKLNLAVLSEHQDAEIFSPEERAAIRAHLPWTRRIATGFTRWEEERVYLPDFLLAERDRLVLKPGYSQGGHGVHVGHYSPQSLWETWVDQALEEGNWIVQERIESFPYLFQGPGDGCCLHDVVWGLFVCGENYGGGFLRMVPTGKTGVINAAQGATEGILFEVDTV